MSSSTDGKNRRNRALKRSSWSTGVSLPWLGLRLDLAHDAETAGVVGRRGVRFQVVAAAAADVLARGHPEAAAQDAGAIGTLGWTLRVRGFTSLVVVLVVPVVAPLGDVAVHVVQAPLVRVELPH